MSSLNYSFKSVISYADYGFVYSPSVPGAGAGVVGAGI
jgi:hypothetical protein